MLGLDVVVVGGFAVDSMVGAVRMIDVCVVDLDSVEDCSCCGVCFVAALDYSLDNFLIP